MSKTIFLDGTGAGHPNVMVETSTGAIDDFLAQAKDHHDIKMAYKNVRRALRSITSGSICVGSPAWDNMMDDIVIFHICRLKLFGTSLPILDSDIANSRIVDSIDARSPK